LTPRRAAWVGQRQGRLVRLFGVRFGPCRMRRNTLVTVATGQG
jgi:hypothetical protein